MAWKLGGTYFETCSCDVVCPCTTSFALGADYDRCRVVRDCHVADGDVDGTAVGGLTAAAVGVFDGTGLGALTVAAVADTPKVKTDGNWRLDVYRAGDPSVAEDAK